jgi:hypothetical protein
MNTGRDLRKKAISLFLNTNVSHCQYTQCTSSTAETPLLTHTMAPDNFIDFTTVSVFRKEDWMGKRYPASNVPTRLAEFRNAALAIPATSRWTLLPDVNLSVDAFVALSLPTAQAALISIRAETCFVKTRPTNDVSCLKTRKLPSLEFVEDAERRIGQGLLDGAQSIEDPAFNGDGLPFWTIQFWKEMHHALAAQLAWEKSFRWLEKYKTGSNSEGELNRTQRHVSSLGRRAPLLAPGASTGTTTLDLTRFLSDRMLTTTLVDLIVEDIAGWVRCNEALSEKFEIMTLVFMHEIEKAKDEDYYKAISPTFLHRLEQRLRGSKKILLFPVHVPLRVHFIAFEIDFQTRTLSYGESCHHTYRVVYS